MLSPVYNFSTTQSSVLIALPTVTATLVRIPLSVSTIRFGIIAPIILSQSVAMFGLFALVIVIFFAPVGPEMFGVFCFLALVIGVAGKDWFFVVVGCFCNHCIGSVFPLCFLQVSFWTPKAHQGLACAAFIGIGAMGTSVFTLVISVCFCSWVFAFFLFLLGFAVSSECDRSWILVFDLVFHSVGCDFVHLVVHEVRKKKRKIPSSKQLFAEILLIWNVRWKQEEKMWRFGGGSFVLCLFLKKSRL